MSQRSEQAKQLKARKANPTVGTELIDPSDAPKSEHAVQTAQEEDQITFGNDLVDFDLDLEEIDSIPKNSFLTPCNNIYGHNTKQIKS